MSSPARASLWATAFRAILRWLLACFRWENRCTVELKRMANWAASLEAHSRYGLPFLTLP